MTQKSSTEQFLFHPIENNRNKYKIPKHSITNLISTQNHIGTNTEQIQLDHGNDGEEIVQVETSESYWKLITEQRQQAIEKANTENQQLHTLIDDISKENDKLRIIANHCDYLQNILETVNAENISHLNETNTTDNSLD
ncbi:unnamed protein product [Adineta steineri]|uniref:Geminin n=2 Tax=Adineta steineri TaxID=433720 RepID=A0A813X0R0_9BILA|nr:unnamed protein product [Adineta steineri]CAF3906747.1 unnamed protein product [Adineta steineri]